jgi:excisionase family DNA binding protein
MEMAESTRNRDQDLLRPGEVARLLGVNRATVDDWVRRGYLPVAYRTPGRHRRYAGSDVSALLRRL